MTADAVTPEALEQAIRIVYPTRGYSPKEVDEIVATLLRGERYFGSAPLPPQCKRPRPLSRLGGRERPGSSDTRSVTQ